MVTIDELLASGKTASQLLMMLRQVQQQIAFTVSAVDARPHALNQAYDELREQMRRRGINFGWGMDTWAEIAKIDPNPRLAALFVVERGGDKTIYASRRDREGVVKAGAVWLYQMLHEYRHSSQAEHGILATARALGMSSYDAWCRLLEDERLQCAFEFDAEQWALSQLHFVHVHGGLNLLDMQCRPFHVAEASRGRALGTGVA